MASSTNSQSKITTAAQKAKAEATELASKATQAAKAEAGVQAETARQAAVVEAEAATEAARAATDAYPEGSLQHRAGEQVAQSLDAAAKALREADMAAMAQNAAAFARRNPLLVLGGAAVAGFAAARFLKASDPAPIASNIDHGPDPWTGHLASRAAPKPDWDMPHAASERTDGTVLSQMNGGEAK